MFLPPDSKMHVEESNSERGESDLYFHQAIDFIESIRQRYPDDSTVYEEFLEMLHLYKEQVLELKGLYSKVRELIGDQEDLWNQFIQYMPSNHQISKTQNDDTEEEVFNFEEDEEIPMSKSKPKKYQWRYGPQYDGPSYEMVRESDDNLFSQRTKFEEELLNNELICVGSKHSKWNLSILLSEKKDGEYLYLKQVEDAMIELEVTICSAKNFVKYLENIQTKIDNEEEVTITKEDLTQVYRGLLRHVYATKKSKIIKALRSNPKSTVPVILKRFNLLLQSWEVQKNDSLISFRAAQEVAYWEAFRKNMNIFKVSESKTLSEKYILEDTLEYYKLHKSFERNLNRKSIHKDIFKLIISQTQIPKQEVKEFWNSIVIPLFNLQKNSINSKSTAQFDQLHELPTKSSAPRHKRKNSQYTIFYSNATIMIFVKYYILMYERLSLARKAAIQKRSIDIRRRESKLNYATSDDSSISFGNADDHDTSSHFEQPVLYPFQTTEIVDNYYERFMELLQNILSEQIEQQTFEEELMKYLGFESYKLFTFVHLFEHLEAKLYDSIHASNSKNLITCFNYELNRTSPFQDDSYFKNVNKVVAFTEDIYEIQFKKTTRVCRIRKTDNSIRYHPLEKWTNQGFSFVQNYVDSNRNSEEDSEIINKSLKVFLNRNKRKAKLYYATKGRSPTDNTAIYNGAECHLCLVTMKFRFKEGSADVFYRVK